MGCERDKVLWQVAAAYLEGDAAGAGALAEELEAHRRSRQNEIAKLVDGVTALLKGGGVTAQRGDSMALVVGLITAVLADTPERQRAAVITMLHHHAAGAAATRTVAEREAGQVRRRQRCAKTRVWTRRPNGDLPGRRRETCPRIFLPLRRRS